MTLDRGAAWRTWRSYSGTGVGTQLFLAGRMAVAPLGPLEPEFRALRGRVLSLGCGHGVVDRYITSVNDDVTIDGYDLDASRIEIAIATQERSPRFRPRVADVTEIELEELYDAALCVDVFHHIPFESHERVARALHRCIRDDGVCLVKEMGVTPHRQYLWNRLHDRIVAGAEPIYCRDPDDMAEVFASAGFDVDHHRRLRRLGLYPQYLVVARKRAG